VGRGAKARESGKVGGGRAKEKAFSMGCCAGVGTVASHSDRPWSHAFKPEGNWDRRGSRRCDRTVRRVGYCGDAHWSSSRDRLIIPGILAWALDAQLALRTKHLPERLDAHSVGPFSVALVVPGSPQLLTKYSSRHCYTVRTCFAYSSHGTRRDGDRRGQRRCREKQIPRLARNDKNRRNR